MRWEKAFEIAREYKREYELLQVSSFAGNLREEVAKRLRMSVPQGDRYAAFWKLIPDVQNMVRDYNVGISNLQPIAPHPEEEQREIYDILVTAYNNGVKLTRDVIDKIVSQYRSGEKSWSEMEMTRTELTGCPSDKCKNKSRYSEVVHLEEVRRLSGREFEFWFAELLKNNDFSGVSVTQISCDKGIDVIAQKEGIEYIFQCKNTSTVGVRALQEIWFAKRDIHHVAVVVTSGRFPATVQTAAKERGIQCWNGKKLLKLIRNSELDTGKPQ